MLIDRIGMEARSVVAARLGFRNIEGLNRGGHTDSAATGCILRADIRETPRGRAPPESEQKPK